MTTLAALTLGSLLSLAPMPPPPDIDPAGLPMWVYWYDPGLKGINCDEGGGCDTFGGGMKIQAHHYGESAACLTSWRGRVVNIADFGRFICRDSGGAIGVRWTRKQGLHVRIDVLSHTPMPPGPFTDWYLEEGD